MKNFTDHEAERRVLSAMMNSEVACIEAIARINEDVFSDRLNRQVFLLLSDLYVRGTKPTYIELIKEGTTLGLIEKTRVRPAKPKACCESTPRSCRRVKPISISL